MKTKIFISRELDDKSILKKTLQGYSIEIIDQYLIEFKGLDFVQPKTDWLFFYSKSGLKFFLKQVPDLSSYKIATFGPSTAALYESIVGKKVDFIGPGEKGKVAESFRQMNNMTSCTFAVGVNSLRSVQKLISCKDHKEVIVYNNYPIEEFDIADPAIAVFTSPMSVATYFVKYPHREHPNIPIGLTTAESLKKIGKPIASIPNIPTEKGLAEEVISYFK